jgi:hypothetical protein
MDYASIIVASISLVGAIVGALITAIVALGAPFITEWLKMITEERNRKNDSHLKAIESHLKAIDSTINAYKNFVDIFETPYNIVDGIGPYTRAVNEVLMHEDKLFAMPFDAKIGDISSITSLSEVRKTLRRARELEDMTENISEFINDVAISFNDVAIERIRVLGSDNGGTESDHGVN